MVAATVLGPVVCAAVAALLGATAWIVVLATTLGAVLAAAVLRTTVLLPAAARTARASSRADTLERNLVDERAVRDLQDRLDRALQDSDGEPATLRMGLRAIAELAPDVQVSLLLAVPDEPRVGWRVRLQDGVLDTAEALEGVPACAALARGATASTRSSDALEACAHLQGPIEPVSATCVPMHVAERTFGSVCLEGPPGERPDAELLTHIEWVVDRMGGRVTEQRASKAPVLPGRPDPLTGLPGRAALRARLRELVRALSPFAVAVLDVDGYGELATDDDADDALQVMTEVLGSTLRPDDLVCRLEGSQFGVVLPQCSAEHSVAALERTRESLVLLLTQEQDLPPITFSAGVVESQRATSLDQLVELAEGACAVASSAGGNRVAVADDALERPTG